MIDAARAGAAEWLRERGLSVNRADDLAAMLNTYADEQTAALRAKLAAIEAACWQDFAGGPDCCVFCGGRKPTHEAGCVLYAPEAKP